MPAGTDLVEWYPRVGASGDDRYTWGIDDIIYAGPSGYSDPPLLSEINDTTTFAPAEIPGGVNGIIAEINRRNRLYYNSRGLGTFTATSYVSGATELTPTLIGSLKTLIDTIRSREGLSAYSWHAVFSTLAAATSASTSIELTPEMLSELRKALATDKITVQGCIPDGDNSARAHRTMKYTYGASHPADTAGVFTVVDDDTVGQDSFWRSERILCGFKLPSDLPTLASGKVRAKLKTGSGGTYWTSVNIECWKSNTYLGTANSGDWTHLDSEGNSVTVNTTSYVEYTWNVGSTYAAGSNYSFILVQDRERTDTAPAAGDLEQAFIEALTTKTAMLLDLYM